MCLLLFSFREFLELPQSLYIQNVHTSQSTDFIRMHGRCCDLFATRNKMSLIYEMSVAKVFIETMDMLLICVMVMLQCVHIK